LGVVLLGGNTGRAPVDARGLLALALSRPADALSAARAVLADDPASATRSDRSVAHQVVGIVLRDAGRTGEAVTELRAALRLADEPDRRADVRATLGVALVLHGRTSAGLAALDAAARTSDGALVGTVLLRRAGMLEVLGRYADALEDLRRAVAVARRYGDEMWEARARSCRALVYLRLGQTARADRELATAGELFARRGQELESAMIVHNRAIAAFQTGALPAALGYFDEAAARYTELGLAMPDLAIDRCAALIAAGLAGEAVAETDAAARGLAGGGQATKRAELLFAAARAAQVAGDPALARERASTARDLFAAQRRPWWRLHATLVLLESRYLAGERDPLLRPAASLARRLDGLGAPEALSAHLLAGRIATAVGHADGGAHFARAAEFRHRGPALRRGAGWLAQALRAEATGAERDALLACRRGLDAIEEHQRTLGATELRAHATAHGTELAAIALRLAVRRRDARMLLRWSERWRAGALLIPPARPPDDPELAAELAALRDLHRRLDTARAADAPLTRLELERRRLEASIRAKTRRRPGSVGTAGAAPGAGPGAGAGVGAGPGTDPWGGRPEPSEILAGLGDRRLVEIVLVDGTLHVVTAVAGRLRLHTVGPLRDAIREVELARFLLRRLSRGRAPRDALKLIDATGERLQRVLLGPAAGDLGPPRGDGGSGGDGGPGGPGGPGGDGRSGADGRTVAGGGRPIGTVIVPPGRLHAVPWALLPVLRTAATRVAPSAAAWLRAGRARPPRRRRVVLVAGPGLDGPAAEVSMIAAGYRAPVVLTRGQATAERTLAALDGAWTAHVAAHGQFRADNPLFSSVRLDDGPLTVHDIGRLRRAPFRLILSSCESGVAAPAGADDLVGMASALVPLGTASLLASVVPVHDAATTPTMVAFHRRLAAGDTFARALLAARTEAAEDPVLAAAALSFIALGR
jgi:tetratricopeptide (TPR) repeat protein